ncbi:sensor histidine kinase [Marinobacter fuscus]|uniref:histidine kinase n=1 Tax=Marinobacter fuscus TaxID=2109942 RepID=A0A2T1K8K2_9GAMM|nr:ATP-binding protein [Marinobacter fuscus]PSF06093.1 sensor histidine kinase [Marinobacter fuscus]
MKDFRFPLFWRVFLSIWLAMAVTLVASNLASRWLLDRERQAIERELGLQELAREALAIRERDGRGPAWRFLRAESERLGLHLMLIEREEGRHRLPRVIRERIQSGWYPHKPAVIELEQGYQLIAWPRMGGDGWLNPHLFRFLEWGLAFLLISLACWWLARMISRPLRHMESTARAIAEGKTDLRVVATIARRRDEIGQMATAFNGMTDRLCQLLDRQQQLLRDISHDLRTPLARQRVAIELAADSGADADLMASIQRQNERLDEMTGQILLLYRVLEQGGDIDREPVQLRLLLNRVLQDAATYAEDRGVDCKLVVAEGSQVVSVLGDEGLLQRAFDNVLQNALDHTPPGQSVSLSLALSGRDILVTITDQGPGVPAPLLTRMFEPFFRGDQSRGGQGWGLGLAIARDIIAAHDGRIRACNGADGGLEVTISLPVFVAG